VPSDNYGIEVGLLMFSENTVNEKLAEIREKHKTTLLKKILVEKWKNRLFVLNIRYGINDILSELEILKQEKTMLNDILDNYKHKNYERLLDVQSSMHSVKDSENKYNFRWQIGAFYVEEIKSRLSNISKRMSSLDDKRDTLNIQNTFSIELTDKEWEYLDINDTNV
jgi:hypothetical protein